MHVAAGIAGQPIGALKAHILMSLPGLAARLGAVLVWLDRLWLTFDGGLCLMARPHALQRSQMLIDVIG